MLREPREPLEPEQTENVYEVVHEDIIGIYSTSDSLDGQGRIITDGTFAEIVARFPYLAEEAKPQQEADSTEYELIQESPEEETTPVQEGPTSESFTFTETPETMSESRSPR